MSTWNHRRAGSGPEAIDPERDEGAVLVWVMLSMAVLLGIGALVIDIGALYVERRQLQNGADAAALAVAQDCAEGACSGTAVADQYADLNANDGAAAIGSGTPCGDGPGLSGCADGTPSGADGATGWVRVNTTTETASGGDQVTFVLAPVISALTGQNVNASAAAAWGPLGSAVTFPFTFSECEFQGLTADGDDFPSGTTYVYSKAQGGGKEPIVPDCEPRSSAGGTAPGGFGWLGVSGSSCQTELSVGDTITGPGDPGNDNLLKKCGLDVRNQEVLIPLFNEVTGTGRNVIYTIAGFAGFVVTGYRLSGATWPSGFSCPPPPGNKGGTGNLRCFRGEFTRIVSTDGDFGGGGFDFGARVVKIID